MDVIRRKYLKSISDITKRNTIAYYSGFLHKPNLIDAAINDKDKQAFMLNVHKLDRNLGLDLILHTPGGDLTATESLVDYLKSLFANDIRAIIPQISMSAGTMISFACKEILMGKHSNLGPIDPQIGNVACQGVIEEFEYAKNDLKQNPFAAPLWQAIIGKYHPTFLGMCHKAVALSDQLARQWLAGNMLSKNPEIVEDVLKEFGDHTNQKTHARHISLEKCKLLGLNIVEIESDPDLQNAILTTHHAYMHTFSLSNAVKIVENQIGAVYMETIRNN